MTLRGLPDPQGVVVEEELIGGMGIDTPGATWTDVAADPAAGVPVAELPLLTALGVAASPDVEDGARGGLAEAGLGADGTVGPLAAVTGVACNGPAAPAAGGIELAWIGVVVELFDVAAVLVAVVTADFFRAAADSGAFAAGDAAAVCTV